VQEARRAVSIEPDYALGHAALAHQLAMHNWIGRGNRDAEMARLARMHADRALLLDPNDATVLGRVAEALCLCGAWNDGLRCAERAFQLHPNSTSSHLAMLLPCLRFRRVDEALAHLDAYALLSPGDPSTGVRLMQRAGVYFMAEDHAKALDTIEQALVINPRLNFALKDRAVYLEALGRRAEARDAIRRLRAIEPGMTLALWKARHEQSLLAPETSSAMFELLERAWLDTPEDPAQS
jgi:tetratricopeptide (TPR) repeat protein